MPRSAIVTLSIPTSAFLERWLSRDWRLEFGGRSAPLCGKKLHKTKTSPPYPTDDGTGGTCDKKTRRQDRGDYGRQRGDRARHSAAFRGGRSRRFVLLFVGEGASRYGANRPEGYGSPRLRDAVRFVQSERGTEIHRGNDSSAWADRYSCEQRRNRKARRVLGGGRSRFRCGAQREFESGFLRNPGFRKASDGSEAGRSSDQHQLGTRRAAVSALRAVLRQQRRAENAGARSLDRARTPGDHRQQHRARRHRDAHQQSAAERSFEAWSAPQKYSVEPAREAGGCGGSRGFSRVAGRQLRYRRHFLR